MTDEELKSTIITYIRLEGRPLTFNELKERLPVTVNNRELNNILSVMIFIDHCIEYHLPTTSNFKRGGWYLRGRNDE